MTTLIKLGGSLVTDKRRAKSFRGDIVRDIAGQLRQLRLWQPDMRLVIGHGSGSFGHHEAQKHHTIGGVRTDEERLGFARVGAVATELSQLILRELLSRRLARNTISAVVHVGVQNGADSCNGDRAACDGA